MASIASPGIGSGLDVNSIVSQLIAIERQPLTVLDRKEAGFQAQLSAYGSLKSGLSSFQSAMRSLNSLSKFQSLTANSADTSIFTASVSPNASPGSYAVEVKQLAQGHKVASAAFANTTDVVGTGTVTIQFGTYNGTVFTANSAKAAQTVTLGSGESSLSGIRTAINAANVGVTASILNDGSGNKLVITSNDTGAANSLKITVTDTTDGNNTDNAGLSRLAYDPTGTLGNGKNLTQTVAAQDAILKVDGIDNITKSSNTVTDVVQGVTLNLLKQSAVNTPTTLSVALDKNTVKASVENFVKAYNDINKTISTLTAYDADTGKSAVLQGDYSTLSIMTRIRQTLTTNLTGLSGNLTLLSQAGVSFQVDGSLAVDSTKLQSAIDNNFNDIVGLFAALGKPSDSLISYSSATDKTQPGAYNLSVTRLATQSVLNGAGTAALADTAGTFDTPVVIDANNDTFSVKIDGIQSGLISLAQASYATSAALTAEIQSKLNGNSALKAAGITATVTFDSAADRLVITSDRYGSASLVEVTAVDTNTTATLGLSLASAAAGLDVAGSINGISATGSGRFLTGAVGTAMEGLKLEVIGGSTGARGTVNYSQGYAYRLDKLADQLLASAGPINSRTDGISRSIEDINGRRESLLRRLESLEKSYRAQYAALDSLLGQLRGTSDFLTRQLASLPGAGS